MLHVHTTDDYFTWKEEQSPPPISIDEVTGIWADEAESNLIFTKFGPTIPWNYSTHRQAWFGDIAKSIAYAIFRKE